jgi:hypothetical protein
MDAKFIERYNLLNDLDHIDDAGLKRERGLRFEDLINEVFASEGTLINKGYHTKGNRSEQIDGAIEIWSRIMLLEVKWVSSNLAASELFSFIGKIENKFQGTLGVFISRNRLTENFITALNRGRRQNVIVVHGEDIDHLFKLDGPCFSDYLEYCIKLLSHDNLTHYPVEKYKDALISATSIERSTNQSAKDFVTKAGSGNSDTKVKDYESLSPEAKKQVFRFALDNFSKVLSSLIPKYSYAFTTNLGPDFFSRFSPDSEEVLSTAEYYYLELLHRDYLAYAEHELLRLYAPLYPSLPGEIKEVFEDRLISDLFLSFSDNIFGIEAAITLIVKELWNDLTVKTLNDLKGLYLDIFTDKERQDDYYQKAFAINLLKGKVITASEIENWLIEKAEGIAEDYNDTDIEDLWLFQIELLELFVDAYKSLARYMGLNHNDFTDFARDLLGNKKNYL